MILQIDDWKFDIDMERTMEYSANEAAGHCDCGYCRNFYAAVDLQYPNFRSFLAQFGLNAEAPDELMPFDLNQQMCYMGVYVVAGRILQKGKQNLCVDGIFISPEIDSQINHNVLMPCFYLTIDQMDFPWVLDEPMKDVVSPANLPDFLRKMRRKLLGRRPKDNTVS